MTGPHIDNPDLVGVQPLDDLFRCDMPEMFLEIHFDVSCGSIGKVRLHGCVC